jgi:hypothetical protein
MAQFQGADADLAACAGQARATASELKPGFMFCLAVDSVVRAAAREEAGEY